MQQPLLALTQLGPVVMLFLVAALGRDDEKWEVEMGIGNSMASTILTFQPASPLEACVRVLVGDHSLEGVLCFRQSY